jgi:kynurenine formamidase
MSKTTDQTNTGSISSQPNSPSWPSGDERGMANFIGPETWLRCAPYLTAPGTRCYELSHPVSGAMPCTQFSKQLKFQPRATRALRKSVQVSNMEELIGEQGGQGTHMDALGHFGYLPEVWDGESELPVDEVRYYGGYKQKEVKPTPESLLLRLGIDKVPPIITTAVLLDAKTQVGHGKTLKPGQTITADDIKNMLRAQGLQDRGLLQGDVLYIYTGWGENWQDPDVDKIYYTKGPGLAYDAAKYLEQTGIVLVALDNPFTDAVNEGQLKGEAPPAKDYPPGLPFAVHHHCLTQAGIHQIQNANLTEIAEAEVWTSCTIILPIRIRGGAGSLVRPVAFGVPRPR